MANLRSALANWLPAKRKRRRSMKPFGLLVHTSGRGVVARAERERVPPGALALAWYRRKSGVHYFVDYDGTITQMLEDDRRGAHVGVSLLQRASYLSGRWLLSKKISREAFMFWKARWPRYKSPQHLYPTSSPNSCYIGVEMVPLAERDEDTRLWFTEAQHEAVRDLALDLAERHQWPEGWMETPRLVGHEDISAFTRWDGKGGWDPGAMRLKPRFDWGRVTRSGC